MSAVEGIFSLRIVTVDFYMEKPKFGLDPCFSEFRAKEIKKVPIIRIFGSNAEGQKACMHVHGIFPYLYIPYDKKDFQTADKAVYSIASSIDKAINISLGQGRSESQHVFKIQLVKGIPFYGYHQKEHQYLKIYMLNPRFLKRAANLLQNGAILGKIFQPHESHVPYILQFFIDYNLYGMSFLHVPNEVIKFRRKNEGDAIPYAVQKSQILDCNVAEKQSTSALELDIGSGFILNRFQIKTNTSAHTNPGIESIWQDERIRRQKLSKECDEVPLLEIPVSQGRPDVQPTESEHFYRIGLVNKLQQLETSMDQTINVTLQNSTAPAETSIKEKKRSFNLKKLIANAVYPEECTQDDILTNASFIADHLSNRSIFHTSTKFSETPSVPESEDIFMDDTIVDEELVLSLTQPDSINQSLREQDLELLNVMQQLEDGENENDIDLDSTLAPLSQNLHYETNLKCSQKAFDSPEIGADTSAIGTHEDDSDNECLNDFTMCMDDMDELLLKLSQPSQTRESNPAVVQLDGADDILRTPKKRTQRRIPITPRTPNTPRVSSTTGQRSPRTPKSVAKKYAPLALTIQSRSLRKNLLDSSKETGSPCLNNDEIISLSSGESECYAINTHTRRKLVSLREQLTRTELRRTSISIANELNGETSKFLSPKRKRKASLDKTHITCNLRTPRRKNERRLRVYLSKNLPESGPAKAPTADVDSETQNSPKTSAEKHQVTTKNDFMAESIAKVNKTPGISEAKVSPRVLLKKCTRIKDLFLVGNNISNGVCTNFVAKENVASKRICPLSLRSRNKINKKQNLDNHEDQSSNNQEVEKPNPINMSPERFFEEEECRKDANLTMIMVKSFPKHSTTKKLRIKIKRIQQREIDQLKSCKTIPKTPKTPIVNNKPYSIIVKDKYEIIPVAGPSHLHRYKIVNLRTPRTSERTNDDPNSDIEDEITSHSFYEKSFIVDSPVFSENAVPSPSQFVKCHQQLNSPSSDNLVIITPRLVPETYEEVQKNCKLYDIPDMVHPHPFYSNYADVTHKKEVGHTVLCIPGKSLNDVENFQSTISDLEGFSNRRKKMAQAIGVGPFQSDDRIREYLSTDKIVLVTPYKLPPTKQEAKLWLKARELLKAKNLDIVDKDKINLEEDSPIKIRRQKVVMQMENEAGETGDDMDCSMRSLSLTPLTPVTVTKPDTPKTADTYNYTPLTAPRSDTKSRRSRKPLKSRLSLSQKLKDICLSNALDKCNSDDVPPIISCIPTDNLLKSVISSEDDTGASRDSSQSNETITNEAVLSELEKSSFIKNLHGSQGSFDDSFGLSIATLNNTYGFKVNLENLQQAKSDVEHNYLTTLSLEVFVSTREDLLPDPKFDAIMCIFYAIANSIPSTCSEGVSKLSGFIIVCIDGDSNSTSAKWNGIDSDVEIKVVASELECLANLVELCGYWDPDIFVGYEIEMSSWGYVMERAKYLDFNIAPLLSRVPSQKVRDFVDEDREQLTDLDVETKLCGRILLDVWRLMRSEIALTSYTFENVLYHILHRRSPLHTHRDLSQWFRAPQTRWIVLEYYLERVKGTLELLDQLDLIGRTSEMAKLIGIQFYEVLSRGSQFRVESMMLRIAKPKNLVPLSPSVQQRAHMRAPEYLPLILEPESRFYPDPVIVLDFQSLYPSMIMAYNYCFSTCLGRVEHLGQSVPFEFGASQLRVSPTLLRKLVDNELVTISPCGAVYVKREIREGILPRMLSEVLDTRQMVKQSMKLHKSSTALQRILHSRQLGLKLIANVTYGYTAANFSGRMPCVEVGDSVVAKGRETLERAIKLVDSHKEWNVRVVYGDTDSLFVIVPGRSRAEAFKIGAEIAELVTMDNPQPVKLKLEKVYQPCILQTKKRYVGYMYESADQKEPIFEAKGIETVRRDGCPAAAKMLEKCLRILFESADVSQVKNYVCRQFTKLLSGKANIQDLIFAKEFRGLNGYKPTACVPALELTRKWMLTDPRKIPRRGERVPFIVTNGPPGLPLIKLVRNPHDVLADEGLKINAIYYITKAIIPPLNRCFLLIGADINEWFTKLPRKVLFTPALSSASEIVATNATKKSTISQYFSSSSCIIGCGRQTKVGICLFCSVNVTKSIVILEEKIAKLQRGYHLTQMICQACCGRPNLSNCASLDCPVLYVLEIKRREQSQTTHIRSIIDELDEPYWKEGVYENINDLKRLTHSSGLNLYWVDQKLNVIAHKQMNIRQYERCDLPTLDDESYLVSLAAARKQIIYVKYLPDLYKTHPEIKLLFNANSIICVPIMSCERKVLAVLELYRINGEGYTQNSLSYIQEFSKWFAIWLSQYFKYTEEVNAYNFYNSLKMALLGYVNKVSSFENFLTRFLSYAKEHVKADEYFFYDYNIGTGFSEFYEEIDQKVSKTATNFKFHKINSFCNKVFDEKKPLLVTVEYGCKQLNKEIKQDPSVPLRYMLFHPLVFEKKFLGILIFSNIEGKTGTNCEFTEDDRMQVKILASLFADALVYRYFMQEEERLTAQKSILRETFLNLLQARLKRQYEIQESIPLPQQIHRFTWELEDLNEPGQLTYMFFMFQRSYRFNWSQLRTFILCTQIAHNNLQYHSITATFHICRTIYCIIVKLDKRLRPHEKAALMIAGLVYYCGHNGLDNHVMIAAEHPLTKMYKTYMKENHRIWMLQQLLRQTNFLSGNKESSQIISTVKTLLFRSKNYDSKIFREKILEMIDKKNFSLENDNHRLYVLLVILRIGVHSRHMQRFNLAKKLRDKYYEENLQMGDLAKAKGYNLLDRKDRKKQSNISNYEINYIKESVLPTLEILTRFYPDANISMEMPNDILKAHEILANSANKRLWDPEACIKIGPAYRS